MVWYDWDPSILEHSIIPIPQSKHHSGEYCINTPLLSSRRLISYIIQCDVYQFITMTWLATSSENCKNENVTHICNQEVTVYHCTLSCCLNKSLFSAVSLMAPLLTQSELPLGGMGGLQILVAGGMKKMRHCVPQRKRKASDRAAPIPLDLLQVTGIGWKCDYK